MAPLFIAVVASLASIFPLVDLVAPGGATRLQMRTTERRESELGRTVQRWMSIDPTTDASTDRRTRRRVRYLGAGLLLAIWAVALSLIAAAG